jgi:hypothetical protein
MSKDILEAYQRASWVNSQLVNKGYSLERICRSRKLRPCLLDWLIMQLGKSELEKWSVTSSGNHWQNLLLPSEAGSNKIYAQNEIFKFIDKLSRKRGKPRIEKPAPQAIGRPEKWTRQYQEDWLITLDELNHSKPYKMWLKNNVKRNSEKSRIQYVLERILTAQGQKDVKSKARARLKTFQNIIITARQLSRKPPE